MTEIELIRKIAKAYNNLNYNEIDDILSEGIIYESQNVFSNLQGKFKVAEYLKAKFETIKKSSNIVYAEIGYVGRQRNTALKVVSAKENNPCLILSQGNLENKVALLLIKTSNNMIDRIDICSVAPHWSQALGTKEFPK